MIRGGTAPSPGTRLAIELAGRAAGSLFADLGALARGAGLWPSLAQLVDAREEPGIEPPDAVVRALAGRDVMLVLDNCEHVLDGVREVAGRMLDDCAGVTMLATSREALGLAAETVWPVPPLSVPPETAGLAEAIEHDAGRLFVERAARALTGFSPREQDAAALVRICRRLDGIPLALELAAVRVKVLGPEEIADRLDDRFRLLARGGSGPAGAATDAEGARGLELRAAGAGRTAIARQAGGVRGRLRARRGGERVPRGRRRRGGRRGPARRPGRQGAGRPR
jgi:predicted ATPase